MLRRSLGLVLSSSSSMVHGMVKPSTAIASSSVAATAIARRIPFHMNNSGNNINKIWTRGLLILTEDTPNPQSCKFIPEKPILPEDVTVSGLEYKKGNPSIPSNLKSPLAKELLKIDGVTSVFLSRDFLTVSKASDLDWDQIKPHVNNILVDFYASEQPSVVPASTPDKPGDNDDSSYASSSSSHSSSQVDDEARKPTYDPNNETVQLILELFDQKIKPMVQDDGGDVTLHSWDATNGIVGVVLSGSCSGCPSSTVTLKGGIENMLKHYIPEVKAVEEVKFDDERVMGFQTVSQ